MALKGYSPAPTGALRQGELIRNIFELRPRYLPIEPQAGASVPVVPIPYGIAVVLCADCDLEWDYKARVELSKPVKNSSKEQQAAIVKSEAKLVTSILLCELYELGQIRIASGYNSDLWRHVESNQDERYHKLPAAPIGDLTASPLPNYYLDFKKAFSIPAESLFEAIQQNALNRIALIPPVFIHNLIQRFYSYLARVGEPD